MNAVAIESHGGPWACHVCDDDSMQCYRCSECGADFVDRGESA